jgi:hypothetical protein
MSLFFPNPSRSYDERRSGVRFWGHDGPLEISFLVERDAIARLDKSVGRGEASILGSFDRYRDKIMKVATRIYARRRAHSCVLIAADF